MPSSLPRTTPTQLWEQWLGRLNPQENPSGQEISKLEALLLLKQNRPFSSGHIRKFSDFISKSTGAKVTILYEPLVTAKKPARTPQLNVLFSNIPNSKLKTLLAHRSFSPAIAELQQHDQVKLRQPIAQQGKNEPLRFAYSINLAENYTLLLLSTAPFSRIDQKFLELVKATLKNRALRQSLATGLSAETERLATLTHHLSEGLVILDKQLKILLWNRPLQRLTGFSPLEAEKQPYNQVLQHPTNPAWLETLLKDYQDNPNRNVFHEDLELETKQKEKKTVTVSGSFLRDQENNIIQTIIIISDITHHKELENRKNEFISIATHELRTPITAIKGYLALLQKNADNLTPKQEAYLNRALEANDRLVKLSEDLLQVIHVEENRVQFALRPVSLLPIVRKALMDLTHKAEKKGLALRIEAPDFPIVIAADPERTEQIFSNLIDNAVKYTQKGRVVVTFEETRNRLTKERYLTTNIIDTGIGLNGREIETIFEKFHRTPGAMATRESGAGLGLFIVKSFVEKQNGKIKVRSGLRGGSTFSVTFPAVEATALGRKT